MGFWEDFIGVKWSIPAEDCWVVAVVLEFRGVWIYDDEGCLRSVHLSVMQRRHVILPAHRVAEVEAALRCARRFGVRIRWRGVVYW